MSQVYRLSFTWNYSDRIIYNGAPITEVQFIMLGDMIGDQFKAIFAGCKYIYSLECGDGNHRLHYQGHLKLKTKRRVATIAKECQYFMHGVHWSPDSNAGSTNAEFYAYDRNKPSWVAGPWHDGSFEEPYNGDDLIREEDFRPWQRQLYAMATAPVHPDHIHWIYEEQGGVGKSSFCKWAAFKHKWLKLIVGSARDLMNLVYKTPARPVYLIDISRTLGKDASMDDLYQALEDLKNGHIINLKYETGEKLMRKPHVFVFSNKQPELEKLSPYKWCIWTLRNLELVQG